MSCLARNTFFSGDTFHDIPGKTIFGDPTKIVPLGFTLWSEGEFHKFIVHELKPIFNKNSYDALCNNCNHFTDRIAMFLVNKHLPEEVTRQPQLILNSGAAYLLKPILNKWLCRDGGSDIKAKTEDSDALIKSRQQNMSGSVVNIQLETDAEPIVGMLYNGENPFIRSECHTPVVSPVQWRSGSDGIAGCGDCTYVAAEGCNRGNDSSCDAKHNVSVKYFDITISSNSAVIGRTCSDIVPCECLHAADVDKLMECSTYIGAINILNAAARSAVCCPKAVSTSGASQGLQPQRSLRPESLEFDMCAPVLAS